MVAPQALAGGEHTVFVSGNDAAAKAAAAEVLKSFGWKDVLDLGDISLGARPGDVHGDVVPAVGRDRHAAWSTSRSCADGSLASDDLDSLFATTPAKFIEERKRIVAALKGAGRKDEAKAVEKIPRPSLAVWTVNQIARRDPELVRRLGAITDRLKVAAGAEYGAAADRAAADDWRGPAPRGGGGAGGAGHDEAGLHLVQRVIANLRAAAGAAETRAALERGRLERDVEEQEDRQPVRDAR